MLHGFVVGTTAGRSTHLSAAFRTFSERNPAAGAAFTYRPKLSLPCGRAFFKTVFALAANFALAADCTRMPCFWSVKIDFLRTFLNNFERYQWLAKYDAQ